MSIIPDSLVWSLVRQNNCFMQKRNGNTRRSGRVVLSGEPMNLKNVHSFKYSGLANSKAVGIAEGADDKGRPCVVLTQKSSKKVNQPAKAVAQTLLKKNNRSSARAVKAITAGTFYREDLTQDALARFCIVNRATRAKRGLAKPMVTKGRRAKKSA